MQIFNQSIDKRDFPSFSFGSLNECKEILRESFLEVDKTIKEFKWIPEYGEIARWMTYTQGKGLLLSGDVGLGKTIIINKVIPLIFQKYQSKVVNIIHAREIGKNLEFLITRKLVSIDDVGTEGLHNEYGVKSEAFIDLIDFCEYKNKIIFISTNLSAKEMIERYGERTLDRIIRLCYRIKLTGESFRK